MRIVVKVGTSTLAYATGRLNIRHTEKLVEVLSDLKNEGHEVILVSSGAIGMGVGKLSLPTRPKDTSTKQACAAVGPVSYTHLDVYKRQGKYSSASTFFARGLTSFSANSRYIFCTICCCLDRVKSCLLYTSRCV